MASLSLTSCQAPNQDFIAEALAAYLGARLSLPVKFVAAVAWQERARLFAAGQIDVCWLCGLWYVQQIERGVPVELLAAPVMANARHAGRPVYYSDVVVRRDSRFQTFADLRGARWAYNEPDSHSGYAVVRDHLARLGERNGYFGAVVESGAHQTSLQMILAGAIDAAAIDCTVLELELQREPALPAQIRIVESLGPSPVPPWVVRTAVPAEVRSALRQALLQMRADPQGRSVLDRLQMTSLAAVTDHAYDPIRAMAQRAQGVRL